MNSSSSVVRKYINNIKSTFPIYGKKEKNYIHNLEISLMGFAKKNPSLTIEDLHSEFGTPPVIIAGYLSSIEEDYLFRKLKIRDFIKKCLAAILIVAFILEGYALCRAYHDYLNSLDANIAIEEVILEETN